MKNADLAILGLIQERPRHGYEIEKTIEERNMREWTEVGFSSIYYILGRLEKQGFVSARLEEPQGRGPARRVYSITAAGRAAWQGATLEALSTPRGGDLTFLLGLVGLPGVPKGEALRALNRYRDELIGRRETVDARRREVGDPLPLFLDGIFDYSLTLAQAEIDWIEEFTQKIKTND